MQQTIRFDRHGFIFNGRRRFILAGTINYFRLHPEDWRGRLEAFKACGFNTVDTYVPWNYHEMEEGRFDFSTLNRDLGRYLALCGELGLWVYFRPGPYICNEWDGGGLPAWLYTKPNVELRQNQLAYLHYVLRYLNQVNQIARERLYTRGGPIILYALENELDFYRCCDPHGYISALKNQALKDGIDVPLTACVGNRTWIKEATGLVDGVIPSPNVYVKGAVERKALSAYLKVQTGQWASGRHMDDIPVFVTEMTQDENTMRRILSAGFKGLSPFNFSGGTHFGPWTATNNWGGQTLISSSIDFGSSLSFDGRLSERYFSCRLLTGMINAFQEQILACDPTTSDDGGPGSPNANLGWKDTAEGHGMVHSLVHGKTAFTFLYNGTAEPQELKVRNKGLEFPRHSTNRVAPNYTHIVVTHLPLRHVGLDATIRYSSAEIAQLRPTSDGAELVLYGRPGETGEICFDCDTTLRLRDGQAQMQMEGETSATLVVGFDQSSRLHVWVGSKLLTIVVLPREEAGKYGLTVPQLQRADGQELLQQTWQCAEMAHQAMPHTWQGNAKAMEELDILRGAAWYELEFETSSEIAGELSLEHAAEFVSVYLDSQYLGTVLGNNGGVKVAIPQPIAVGKHTLRFRTEIWGHSNFDEPGWPSGRLGSLRGISGAMRIGEVSISGQWRCGAEQLAPAGQAAPQQGTLTGEPGKVLSCALDLPALARGGTLVLQGTDVLGDLYVGEMMLGRFAFGPSMTIKLTGGPGNEFFLPKAVVSSGAQLRLIARPTANSGGLSSVVLHPLQ